MQYPKLTTALFVLSLLFSHLTYSQWFQQSSGTNSQLLTVYFVNQNTGFACGLQGKVLRTTNGGTNWNASVIIDTIVKYNTIYFPSTNTGYIAGDNFYVDTLFHGGAPKIIKTTNSGLSWLPVLQDTNYTLRSVYFINDNTGFACGGFYANGENKFLKTTNGGINWNVSSTGNGYLYFVAFNDVNTGFATGYTGGLYKTSNSGLNWAFTAAVTGFGYCTRFLDVNTGFITGGNSISGDSSAVINKTTDGGTTWNTVYNDHKGLFNYIVFVNSATGYAAGTADPIASYNIAGRILKTTNSGNNWFVDSVFNNFSRFNSIFFNDALTGYVVGGNGVILKTTNGGNPIGIQQVGTTVPMKFNLSQNYPNPFNPNTKIEFALPKTAMTRIVVYDDIGRLITVVVDQELKAGTYKVDWDANNYPSGVYFYKLTADDFSETRKMVLVK